MSDILDSTGPRLFLDGTSPFDDAPMVFPGGVAGARPDNGGRGYPVYDGITHKLPAEMRPASWPTDGTEDGTVPEDFGSWHSAYQAEYLMLQSDGKVQLGEDGNVQAFYALTEDGRVVNLRTITAAEIGNLSNADQARLAGALQHLGRLEELGLTNASTSLSTVINDLIAEWQAAAQPATGPISDADALKLPFADMEVFAGQLRLLLNEIEGKTLLARAAVEARIGEVSERYERAKIFHETEPPVRGGAWMREYNANRLNKEDSGGTSYNGLGTSGFVFYATSSDFGRTVQNGYLEYMRAERNMLSAAQRRAADAKATFDDPTRDASHLIMRFQMLYESAAEARADAGTEEIRQLHKLLQDYSAMQQMVGKQISFYDPANPGERRRFMNVGAWTQNDGTEKNSQNNLIADPAFGRLWGAAYQFYAAYEDGTFLDEYYPNLLSGTDPRDMSNEDKFNLASYADIPIYNFSLLFKGKSDMKDRAMVNARRDETADMTPKWTENELDQEQMNVLSMFVEVGRLGTDGKRAHPIEALFGIDRPNINIVAWDGKVGAGSLELMTKSEWDTMSSALAETVTVLNQQNQIRQNEIDKATKSQSRHFELGNNALQKMNDMILAIGRI